MSSATVAGPGATAQTPPGKARAALLLLAASAFVMGTTEFIIVGVLDLVARDLRLPVATAGELVMAYALGISIGGPLLNALLAGWCRKQVLLLSLGVFALANVAMVLAGNFTVLLAARFVPGSMHGLFVGVASVMAARLVPAGQQGRAMALVFGGVAVATVAGVPLGTWLSQALGWRATFGAVVVSAAAAMVAAWRLLPSLAPVPRRDGASPVRAALAAPVLAMLGVGMLLIGGQFGAYTYIAPYLKQVGGATDASVSLYLLAYGAASAVGMFAGGAFADRGASRTLIGANLALPALLLALYAGGSVAPLAAALLALWGFIGFGLVPSLQLRVVGFAGPGAELAATLSASAVNMGIAAASAIGGQVLERFGVAAVLPCAAALCALALPLTLGTHRLQPPRDGQGAGLRG